MDLCVTSAGNNKSSNDHHPLGLEILNIFIQEGIVRPRTRSRYTMTNKNDTHTER